ncbi:MAG: PAS domain-containing protein [Gemmatimonadaceae bacterium]
MAHARGVVDAVTQREAPLAHPLDADLVRYRHLFNFAPVPYVVTDPAGAIGEANLAAAVLFGKPNRFLIGKPLAAFVHPEERSGFRLALDRVLQVDAVQEFSTRLETVVDGVTVVTATVSAHRDAEGAILALYWILRDDGTQFDADLL